MCQYIGIDLYLWDKLLQGQYKVVEELLLQRENLVLCTQYLLFVFLQFLCDITLCLSQRLLAHPLLWDLFFIGVAHLQVIAKDIVVAHLQRRDARLLGLTFLYLQEIVLT